MDADYNPTFPQRLDDYIDPDSEDGENNDYILEETDADFSESGNEESYDSE